MSYYGVDVRTPIFYRESFASALETQSSKTYARLTHTPIIAEHLPHGAATGAQIAQYGTSRLRSLKELEKFLLTLLDDGGGASTANPLNVSVREPGLDELERTVLLPASLERVRLPQHTQHVKKDRKCEALHSVASSGNEATPAVGDGSRISSGVRAMAELSSPLTEKKIPRSVSFPAEYSCNATPQMRNGTFAEPTSAESKGTRVWRWVSGLVWRGAPPDSSSSTSLHHRDEQPGSAASSINACGCRRERTMTSGVPVTLPFASSHLPPTSMNNVPSSSAAAAAHVPLWVRAAFTSAAAAVAAATVDSASPSSAFHSRRAPSTQEAAVDTAQEASVPLTRGIGDGVDAVALVDGGVSGLCSVPLASRVTRACVSSSTAASLAATAKGDSVTSHFQEGGPPHVGSRDDTSSQSTQSPHPQRSVQKLYSSLSNSDDAEASLRQRADGEASHSGNTDDALDASGHTNTPAVDAGEGSLSSPLHSDTRADTSSTRSGNVTSTARGEKHKRWHHRPGEPRAPVTSTVETEATTAAAAVRTLKTMLHHDSKPDASTRADAAAAVVCNCATHLCTSTSHELKSSVNASSTSAADNERCDGGSGGETQQVPMQRSVASHTTAGTNALARWDRHAYAVELVGWLHLLVWVRCQVIHFLRDLSGMQGLVAWSAWYWSWAQEHPVQASLHQALASRRFWRGFWARGLNAQISEVQYETSGHMFTLKNAFRLIVSYIGATYTALEQLNAIILRIQHNCEMTSSPMAAAAAAAAARSWVAGLGAGSSGGDGATVTAIPELGSGMTRTHAMVRRDFLLNHNSVFWKPAPVTMVADDFSPLAPPSRDNAVDGHASVGADSPMHGIYGSGFDDVCDQDSVNEAAVAEAAEEAEATSALQVLDGLRHAIYAMLQEQRAMFCFNGQQLDVLESNDFFGWPGDYARAEGRTWGSAPAMQTAGLPMHAESIFAASTIGGTAYLGSPSVRLCDDARPTRHDDMKDEEHPVTARDGAVALLQCVEQSQRLVLRLKGLVQRAHNPPTSRHWQRIVVAAAATLPHFIWLYRRTPEELVEIARGRFHVVRQIVKLYVVEPFIQLKESLFYVRPGVEDRRGAFERDAAALANIIRDFHEDMYPNMPVDRLEAMRDVTFDRLRAGVGDPEGFGLIEQQYRHSVRHPIRSVIFGDLPRILLIQMSYQALEMSRVANGVDEVLEGNDLNFKVMALLPVFAAGGVLVSWGLLRYRANYRPIRMRMKLLWRSLFRVISFAGNGQQALPPFMRGTTSHAWAGVHLSTPASRVPQHTFPSDGGAPMTTNTSSNNYNPGRHCGTRRGERFSAATTAAAAILSRTWKRSKRDEGRHLEEVEPADFTGSSEDDRTSSFAASLSTHGGVASARQLTNYEQGMVLLLSHVMRSLAAEYLRSYEYFHELLEDLNDLESTQSSRHQRLATMERMQATHASLF
jgi:hypothetical protein